MKVTDIPWAADCDPEVPCTSRTYRVPLDRRLDGEPVPPVGGHTHTYGTTGSTRTDSVVDGIVWHVYSDRCDRHR